MSPAVPHSLRGLAVWVLQGLVLVVLVRLGGGVYICTTPRVACPTLCGASWLGFHLGSVVG